MRNAPVTSASDLAQVVVADARRGRDYSLEARILGERNVQLVLAATRRDRRRLLRQADVVCVHVRPLTAEEVHVLDRCVGIVAYGVALDAIDTVAAAEGGIPVRNVPGYCTDEVSDHALGLLLAATRAIVPLAAATRRGRWRSARRVGLRRLRGQTLGVVGAGRIGRLVAAKARAFGYRTIAFDPYLGAAPDPELALVDFDELLADSDAIVLAAATSPTSRGLFGDGAFSRVKPGVVFVNVARGAIVDEDALLRALEDGRVAWACLDVRREEPPAARDRLLRHSRVISTPHVGANSAEAARDLNRGVAETALELLEAAGRINGRA